MRTYLYTKQRFVYIATAAHCLCDFRTWYTGPTTIIFSDGSKVVMSNIVLLSPWIIIVIILYVLVILYVIVCMFAVSQAIVPSRDYIFNTACEYNCKTQPYECDFALMKISANMVPASAQKAALQVYRWNDEAGKNMEIYGYGDTGRADQFPTVSVPPAVLHVISNSNFVWRRAPLNLMEAKYYSSLTHIFCIIIVFFETKVQVCWKMLDADVNVNRRFFRHAQNVVTSVSQGILKYKMDCTSPPPRPLEGLSSDGDSGGCVGGDTMVMSMWAWAWVSALYPLTHTYTHTAQPSLPAGVFLTWLE